MQRKNRKREVVAVQWNTAWFPYLPGLFTPARGTMYESVILLRNTTMHCIKLEWWQISDKTTEEHNLMFSLFSQPATSFKTVSFVPCEPEFRGKLQCRVKELCSARGCHLLPSVGSWNDTTHLGFQFYLFPSCRRREKDLMLLDLYSQRGIYLICKRKWKDAGAQLFRSPIHNTTLLLLGDNATTLSQKMISWKNLPKIMFSPWRYFIFCIGGVWAVTFKL